MCGRAIGRVSKTIVLVLLAGGLAVVGVASADGPSTQGDIQRIVRNVKVFARGGECTGFALLKGPLMWFPISPGCRPRHDLGMGRPGRPEAIFKLTLFHIPGHPQWLEEDRHPLRQTLASGHWGSQVLGYGELGLGHPSRSFPRTRPAPTRRGAASPNEGHGRPFHRLGVRQSRALGDNAAWRPIYRYTASAESTLDGAIFAFVERSDNPQILLVIEAEKDAKGSTQWKFDAARTGPNGYLLKLDGKEVWKLPWINGGPIRPRDPYYLRYVSADEEGRSGGRPISHGLARQRIQSFVA